MAAAASQRNQRSWKNYLLNSRYQLRFTLFMTGLCAVLMALLGWWVQNRASRVTDIAITNVIGSPGLPFCEQPELPGYGVAAPMPGGGDDDERFDLDVDLGLGDGSGGAGEGALGRGEDDPLWEDDLAPAGDDFGAPEGGPAREDAREDAGEDAGEDSLDVELGEVSEEIAEIEGEAAAAPAAAGGLADHYECRMEQAVEMAGLVGPIYRGERRITVGMVAVGLILLVGITLYGIVMTHRVAGPLYKISLYLNKLRDGRYDTVYNLRKGDQLVAFYEQFKRAHAGLRSMQDEDLAALREAIAMAEREGLAERSAELAELVEEMRALVEKKENSLG